MKHIVIYSLVICVAFTLLGCGAQPIPTTTSPGKVEIKDSKALMQEWHQLTKADYEHVDMDRAMIIANELALQGADGLAPLFEVIENPEETPMAKMLAVVSLDPHVNDSYMEKLMPLTESKYDSITRGCAAHLLGNCVDSVAFFKVRDLAHDADPHVSKVASMVMLRKGDIDVMPKILEIWDAPDASPKDREEIVLGMPPMLAGKHIRIFTEAISNDNLSVAARSHAIMVLGKIASPDVIPAMKSCQEKLTDEELRKAVDDAIVAIEKHEKEGAAPMQIQMPNGVNLVVKPKESASPTTSEETPAEAAPEN